MSVIANTTVISSFASIDQLDVLRLLYGELYISSEVYEEIQLGLEEGYQFYTGIDQYVHPLAEQGWIKLTTLADTQELRYFSMMPSRLHRGEAASLAIARYRGWTFLTDDKSARAEAARQAIRFAGSVGCLVLAVDRGICSLEQANAWLREMILRGYWSPVLDLTPIVKVM